MSPVFLRKCAWYCGLLLTSVVLVLSLSKSIVTADQRLQSSKQVSLLSTETSLGQLNVKGSNNSSHAAIQTAQLEDASSREDEGPRVLVAEVQVQPNQGELDPTLENLIYSVIETQAGRTTTRTQLQQDINSIFATGYFADVDAQPEDTDLGVRVTFLVQANPVLTDVRLQGNEVLPQTIVDEIFDEQKGGIINLIDFQEGILELNQWYQDQGYVLAQVVTAPQVSPDGVVTLEVAEGVIESIEVRYINDVGQSVDDEGNPVQGRTRPFIITREFETEPGEVFNQARIEQDFQRVFGLGIFEDVVPGLEQAEDDPRKVKLIINISERNTGSIAIGAGSDFEGRLFLTGNYQNSNLGGRGQSLVSELQVFVSSGIALSASIDNPGGQSKHRLLSVEGQTILAAVEAANSGDTDLAIEKVQGLLESARQNNQREMVALVLNTLGHFYQANSDYAAAIQSFQEASDLFQHLSSPGLALVMQLNLAEICRQIGQPQTALNHYYNALLLLHSFKDSNSLRLVLGDAVLTTLTPDWRIESDQLDARIGTVSQLFESAILLDISNTYSAMGDYQQAIYILNSPQLFDSVSVISKEIVALANDVPSLLENQDGFDVNSSENEEVWALISRLFPEAATLNNLEKEAISLIQRIPNIMQLTALKFIYTDLGEAPLSESYQAQIEQQFRARDLTSTFASQNRWSGILSEVYDILVGQSSGLEEAPLSGLEFLKLPEVREGLETLATAVIDAFYFKDREKINIEEVDSALETLSEALTQQVINDEVFSEGLNDALTPDQLDTLIQSAIKTTAYLIFFPENIDALVPINQTAIDLWPSDLELIQPYEWSKGFLYYPQVQAYTKNSNYQAAVEAYRPVSQAIQSSLEYIETAEIIPDSYKPLLITVVKRFQIGSYFQIADLYLSLANYDQAKALYYQALAVNEGVNSLDRAELGELYYLIAYIDFLQGRFSDAQTSMETLLEIHESYFPRDSLSGGTGFISADFQHSYGIANLGKLSTTLNIVPDNPWLQSQAVEERENISTEAVDEFRSTSHNIIDIGASFCSSSVDYFICKQKYFALYIEILLARHQASPVESFNVLAFEASERARVHSPQLFQNLLPSSTFSPQQQRLLERRLRLNQPAFLSTIESQVLADDTILLEYFLGEDKSYLWVVSQSEDIQTFELPPRAEIEAKAREFLDLLTEPTGWVRPRTTAKVGQELSQMLLGPVADQLSHQRLLIVADGVLQYLPFTSLPNPAASIPADESIQGEFAPHMVPLIINHEIVNLPSASALIALREDRPDQPSPRQQLAIFADPIFNHEDPRVGDITLSTQLESFDSARLDDIDVLYDSIPHTQQESTQIGSLVSPLQRQVFTGYDANLNTVLNGQLGQFQIVHFATHGIFNSSAPERSGIYLSSFNKQGEIQPALLSPADAFNFLDLSGTELVVLSGCRTGLSANVSIREGLTGFTGGLLAAGTDRIVTSLWSVRDDATQELMTRFYRRMLDSANPMTPSQALRAAQISMWKDPQWQIPYYWSGFVLQGEWN